MLDLTLEFATFEASEYVHTYSGIQFNFDKFGRINRDINVFTMSLNPYRTTKD